VLVLYVQTHPERLPLWIPMAMLIFLITTILVGAAYLLRLVRKQVAVETPGERKQRQAGVARGLEIGIVVGCLISLNGIRLVLQHTVPWQYALVGLSIDFLLIVSFWTPLIRLKRLQIENAGQTPPRL
jgi:Na+/H+ antiporter NhaD/arsenite permease-like protein